MLDCGVLRSSSHCRSLNETPKKSQQKKAIRTIEKKHKQNPTTKNHQLKSHCKKP